MPLDHDRGEDGGHNGPLVHLSRVQRREFCLGHVHAMEEVKHWKDRGEIEQEHIRTEGQDELSQVCQVICGQFG